MILFLGFLFMVIMFVLVSAMNSLGVFLIDTFSILLIIVPLMFFFWVSKTGGTITRYIKSSFKKEYSYDIIELQSISAAMKNTIQFTLGAGGFGFIIGTTSSLYMMSVPERLGLNLSVSFITMIYAVGLSLFVFFPLYAWAVNRSRTMQ